MLFLRLAEFAIAALFFWVLVTQVMIPLWNGRPVFPFFTKTRELEEELGEVRQEADNARLRKTIDREKKKLPDTESTE